MVRKVTAILTALLLLLSTLCVVAGAESYQVYDGNLSSTYTTYFRDIVSNISLLENYVYFRSGQNEYTMIVGDLNFSNGSFSLNNSGTVYTISNNNSYNGSYIYKVNSINSLSLSVNDEIIYSDLGNYPQLEERGQKYEILSTVLIVVALLCVCVFRIFNKR